MDPKEQIISFLRTNKYPYKDNGKVVRFEVDDFENCMIEYNPLDDFFSVLILLDKDRYFNDLSKEELLVKLNVYNRRSKVVRFYVEAIDTDPTLVISVELYLELSKDVDKIIERMVSMTHFASYTFVNNWYS